MALEGILDLLVAVVHVDVYVVGLGEDELDSGHGGGGSFGGRIDVLVEGGRGVISVSIQTVVHIVPEVPVARFGSVEQLHCDHGLLALCVKLLPVHHDVKGELVVRVVLAVRMNAHLHRFISVPDRHSAVVLVVGFELFQGDNVDEAQIPVSFVGVSD